MKLGLAYFTFLSVAYAFDSHHNQDTSISFGEHLADLHPNTQHTLHAPGVAFQCGYKNKYLNQNTGEWVSDKDLHATCLTGKLDILKYCRKVYPQLQITNIVEAESLQTIADWCKIPEGTTCKWSFLSKPYKCLVGEFESEALLVPQGCHFGHVDDRTKCNDFQYWNRTAQLECSKRLGDLRVESFSMLEPCGLDMFSGVEYVCCPNMHTMPNVDLHVKVKLEQGDKTSKSPTKPNKKVFGSTSNFDPEDEDDDDDDSDDDDDNLEEEKLKGKISNPSVNQTKFGKLNKVVSPTTAKLSSGKGFTNGSDESSEESDDQSEAQSIESLDIYFRVADPENEHEAYQKAVDRLDRKHKNKVTIVMQEWSELEKRYNDMREKDPKHAENFRHEMTTRFQKTIAALETENKEQRRQIDEVHQQRVESTLNERKRDAIKRYRDALADTKPSAPKILRHLESYIRAEEKDRVHALNRYIHLLKSDSEQAYEWKTILLRKLHDIDLRINGTITLLKELPIKIEEKIKKSALDYWKNFRLEHTPEVDDETLLRLDYTFNDRLLAAYESKYKSEIAENKAQQRANQIAIDSIDVSLLSSTAGSAPITSSGGKLNLAKKPMPLARNPPELVQNLPSTVTVKKIVEQLKKTIEAGSKIDDVVVFDPVIEIGNSEDFKESKNLEENNAFGAYAKHNILRHEPVIVDAHYEEGGYSYMVFSMAGVALLVSVALGILLMRKRNTSRRSGFIEVDACTPEERHVALMQGNGYENPTYKYFDDKI